MSSHFLIRQGPKGQVGPWRCQHCGQVFERLTIEGVCPAKAAGNSEADLLRALEGVSDGPIKCATFDPEAGAAISPEVRARMDADWERARKEGSDAS